MNCIIGQSGGPTSVINSSLAGAISAACDLGYENIYGMENGIEGLLDERLLKIDKEKFLKEDIAQRLKARPASILGSCRYKLPEDFSDPAYEKIFRILKKFEISSLIYIGGNDSMDTVEKLNAYMDEKKISRVRVIGVPKTIDNDLCEMDHSPGYPSAAKYVLSTIKAMRADVDIYNIQSVTFLEIMGRDAGRLAASSLLANYGQERRLVNLIYLKEVPKSKEEILEEVREALKLEDNLLVVVSEGFMDKDGYFSGENSQVHDQGFNHPILAGIAGKISAYINEKLDIKTKTVELSILQRSNILISQVDSDEAFDLGYKALEVSREKTNLIPILKRRKGEDYQTDLSYVAPSSIANKEKFLPKDRLTSFEKLEEEMTSYLLPLIQGEVPQIFVDGVVDFVSLEDFAEKVDR